MHARCIRSPDAYYELGLSLLHANALASHRFNDGRGQWLAAVRRSNLDDVAGHPGFRPRRAALHGCLRAPRLRVDAVTRGSVHALLAKDEAEINSSDDTEHADASYSNIYFWATLEREFTERWDVRGLVSYTDIDSVRDATVTDPRTSRWHRHRRPRLQRAGTEAGRAVQHRTLAAPRRHRRAFARRPLRLCERGGLRRPTILFRDRSGGERVQASSPKPAGEHFAIYYTVRARLIDALTAESRIAL